MKVGEGGESRIGFDERQLEEQVRYLLSLRLKTQPSLVNGALVRDHLDALLVALRNGKLRDEHEFDAFIYDRLAGAGYEQSAGAGLLGKRMLFGKPQRAAWRRFVDTFVLRRGRIVRAPGHLMDAVAEFFASPETYKHVFQELIGDLREEYSRALFDERKWKARWIRFAYVCRFGASVWQHGIGTLVQGFVRMFVGPPK
jgi:hypothetical protein